MKIDITNDLYINKDAKNLARCQDRPDNGIQKYTFTFL